MVQKQQMSEGDLVAWRMLQRVPGNTQCADCGAPGLFLLPLFLFILFLLSFSSFFFFSLTLWKKKKKKRTGLVVDQPGSVAVSRVQWSAPQSGHSHLQGEECHPRHSCLATRTPLGSSFFLSLLSLPFSFSVSIRKLTSSTTTVHEVCGQQEIQRGLRGHPPPRLQDPTH